MASTSVLNGRAYVSAPGTPNQLVTLPTAITSVSHGSTSPLWSCTQRRSMSMASTLFLMKRTRRCRAISRNG